MTKNTDSDHIFPRFANDVVAFMTYTQVDYFFFKQWKRYTYLTKDNKRQQIIPPFNIRVLKRNAKNTAKPGEHRYEFFALRLSDGATAVVYKASSYVKVDANGLPYDYMRGGTKAIKLFRASYFAHKSDLIVSEKTHFADMYEGKAHLVFFEGQAALVMKLLDGFELFNYFQSHNISYLERLQIVQAIMTSVKEMHGLQKIHNDLKPENIFWNNKTGQCAIADYGFTQNKGNAVITLGTLSYVAPERHADPNAIANEKMDYFSLAGIIAFSFRAYKAHRRELDSQEQYDATRIQREPYDLTGLFNCIVMPDDDKPIIKQVIEQLGSMNPQQRPENLIEIQAQFATLITKALQPSQPSALRA